MIRLAIMFTLLPFMIIAWCLYHPAMAKIYVLNSGSLLWGGPQGTGDWGTRCFFLLFLLIPISQIIPRFYKENRIRRKEERRAAYDRKNAPIIAAANKKWFALLEQESAQGRHPEWDEEGNLHFVA